MTSTSASAPGPGAPGCPVCRPRARAPRRAADAGAASRWTARACGADLPYTYLGADDRAGANYTGQPAVHSNYRQDG